MPVEQALRGAACKSGIPKISNEFSRAIQGSRIAYLDAGSPFFDWFPMIPHISHNDGRKIDLALIHAGGAATPSPVGCWGFVQPCPGDQQPCGGTGGRLRWYMAWLQSLLPDLPLDRPRMRALLLRLVSAPAVRRIFIERLVSSRLGLDHSKLRFQRCAAARHDDHIHVEF